MSTSPISPISVSHDQPVRERTDPRPDPSNGTREVPNQSQNIHEGNIKAAEKISADVKKPAIDSRKPRVPDRGSSRQHLDTKG